MKNREISKILNALQRIDSYTNEAGHPILFEIEGEASYAIARNISLLTAIHDDLEKTRIRLLKAVLKPGEKTLSGSDPRFQGFVDELEKVYDMESEFKPYKFKRSGLLLDRNTRMSRQDIAAILPLLINEDSDRPAASAGDVGVPAAH